MNFYNLDNKDFSYIKSQIDQAEQLEKFLEIKRNEISSLISFICHQNNLEGNWHLNLDERRLIKLEEKEDGLRTNN